MTARSLDEEMVATAPPQVTKERRVGSKTGSPGFVYGGWGMNVVETYLAAMLHTTIAGAAVQATFYGHRSGERLDPELVAAGRAKERHQMDEFEVFRRVPSNAATGTRVRAQWLDDERTDSAGQPFVRSRLVAMQVAWEARSDCFAATPCLACVRLVFSFAAET